MEMHTFKPYPASIIIMSGLSYGYEPPSIEQEAEGTGYNYMTGCHIT